LNRKKIMLADSLKTLLGTTFVLYTKVHGMHFNVEGPDFPQYHDFLGDMYEEIYASVDIVGEYIRTLDSYTPGNLARMLELSIITEQTKIPRAELMFVELFADTEKIIELIKTIFDEASEQREQGIANYMADLQDLYSKKLWMLRSILRKQRA